VPARVAERRYRKLMTLQRSIAHAKNRGLIGRELEVLVEGTSDEHEYVMMGRHAGQAPEKIRKPFQCARVLAGAFLLTLNRR